MTTFKYQDKIITTPNLEKKLKRMKLQLSDIEIIEAPEKIEEISNLDDFHLTHKPYLESLQNGGYAIHYLLNNQEPPTNWIPARIKNNKVVI